jgi:hypothetical protein
MQLAQLQHAVAAGELDDGVVVRRREACEAQQHLDIADRIAEAAFGHVHGPPPHQHRSPIRVVEEHLGRDEEGRLPQGQFGVGAKPLGFDGALQRACHDIAPQRKRGL